MPKLTIDGREVEVEAGTNLIEAGRRAGVAIPHYCYHPRLSVVGQCRMCVVKIDGMPKLQTACSTQVFKDGMSVHVDHPEVKAAQEGVMEFLLINHPLDCPICDQAGECGLQDYSFQHGQAFSRFDYAEKRTYPEKERIPLGSHVLLNMNRCILCTRCVRFTEEIAGTGELGLFERGAQAEIGIFPGRPLDNPLSGNVVDICPVGALTSTEFRFAERVWYLDKKPSLCTGCDIGCNVSLEHRRGAIRRYKPRLNEAVNDHWLCDYGRLSFRRYEQTARLMSPRLYAQATTWPQAIAAVGHLLNRSGGGPVGFLGSGHLTTEEAYLLRRIADRAGSPHRAVYRESGEARSIPNPSGGLRSSSSAPNVRGAELAGLVPGNSAFSAKALLEGNAAAGLDVLWVADGDLGAAAANPDVVARLRAAKNLIVAGWADGPLAQAADIVLPTATHAERSGSFLNVAGRLQRFERAFPAPGQVRPALEVLGEILRFAGEEWPFDSTPGTFDRMAELLPQLGGLRWRDLGAGGVLLGDGKPAPESGGTT
jgi:NADH-quinone oxidoreductase subunit G